MIFGWGLRDDDDKEEYETRDYWPENLKKIANNGLSDFITAWDSEKDILAIAEIFHQADKEVFILTDHLNPKIYDRKEVIRAADEFLRKRGSRLKIAMQLDYGAVNRNHDGLIYFLFKNHKEKVVIGHSPELDDFEWNFIFTKTRLGNYAVRIKHPSMGKHPVVIFNYDKTTGNKLSNMLTNVHLISI